jgi:HAE1 family hydrophobic/amphiphilic exporter-1
MKRSAVVIRHSARTLLLVVITGAATLLLLRTLPSGFLTTEDQGYLMVSVQLPDAASAERTEKAIEKAVAIIRAEEGVRYEASSAGFDLISGVSATSSGIIFVTLEPYGKRSRSAAEIAESLNERLYAEVLDGSFYAFEPPSIPGLGVTSGVTFMLQNRGSGDVRYLADEAKRFMDQMREMPEIASVSTQFDAEVPQRHLVINEPLALQQGVDVEALRELITTMYGGEYVGNFNRFGRLYQTYIQADSEYRRTESDIEGFYINNSRGESIPVSSFVELRDTVGVEYINQFNLYDAIAINATPATGVSSTSAMEALERLAEEQLPEDVTLAWSGVSYQEANASTGGVTYLLALIFVFLALAALYNSWALPMSVLLGVPLALCGSLLFVWLGHLLNPIYVDNIFMKVSLVMLIGLSAKSAILVVEYADRKFFDEGLNLGEAALAAAKLRLRPILMTAVAFIVGIMPLVFASGAYSVARNIMGVSLVGGMLVATLLGIFVYPALYYLVGRVAKFEKRREKKHKQQVEYERESTL